MPTYKRKTKPVTAIEYNGSNLAEIIGTFNLGRYLDTNIATFVTANINSNCLYLPTGNGNLTLNMNNYVMKEGDGPIHIYEKRKFEELFEVV